jgi:hypothetical protein
VQRHALSPAEIFQPSFFGEIYVTVTVSYPDRRFKGEILQFGQLCKLVFGEVRETVKVRSTDHKDGKSVERPC